jgi:sigma-B regulation protein RsbU (phosphoserine phosphatase)
MTTTHYTTESRFAESRTKTIGEFYQEIKDLLQEASLAVLIYHRLRMELEIHLFLPQGLETYSLREIAPEEFDALGLSDIPADNPVYLSLCQSVGYCPVGHAAYLIKAVGYISATVLLFAKQDLKPLSDHVERHVEVYTLRLRNAILADALDRNLLELELLQETGEILSMSLRIDDVFQGIVAALKKLHPFDALGIFILSKDGETIEEIFSSGYEGETSRHLLETKADRGLVGWATKTGESVIVPNVHEDPRYVKTRETTASELVVPLFSGRQVIGAFNLESDQFDAYSPLDLEMVRAFANQAALSITRARLYKEMVAKNRIEDQLQVARDIQKSFLPRVPPSYPGFDFDAINISSEEVGGDYFDFIPIVDHQLGITIADVSGKGLPASLIMASYRASLIAEIRNNYALRTVMRKVNNLIFESVERGNFVTAVYGVLDTRNRVFTYSNAGHNPPFILRKSGEVESLADGGLILGIVPERQYQECPVQFKPGDIMVMYTDGVTDTENDKGEQFDIERLVELVRKNRRLPAKGIRAKIVDEISRFRSDSYQPDDLTLVIVKSE